MCFESMCPKTVPIWINYEKSMKFYAQYVLWFTDTHTKLPCTLYKLLV